MSITQPIKDLIHKSEIQEEALNKLLLKSDNKHEIDKFNACIRFIKGFKNDLKALL